MTPQPSHTLHCAEGVMLPCLNKMLFGLECPGCGLQRALYFLSEGAFAAAFQMYPAIYPIVLLLLFVLLSAFVKVAYAHTIRWALLYLTVSTILVSYLLKINRLFT